MRNVLSFDVEDWHQSTFDFDLPITARVVDNTGRILDLLEECGVHGTFFVLGLVAEAFPSLVRRIQVAGHEVANHGWSHRPVHAMDRAGFQSDLRRSRDSIEQATGQRLDGYRAPDFSITTESLWALEVLAAEGYRYDSSLFPFRGPRYGIPAAFPAPCLVRTRAGSLCELPLTTTEWLGRRWPAAGGGYFRLFPYAYHRAAVRRMNRAGAPAISYFHPYEIDPEEISASPHAIPLSLRLSQGLGRRGVAARLRRLLRDFSWGPARACLGNDPRALCQGRVLDLTGLPGLPGHWHVEAAS